MTLPRAPRFTPFETRGRRTIAAILLTFTLLSALSVGVSIWATSRSQDQGTLVEIAARQRTLAERYVNEVLLAHAGQKADPDKTAALLAQSANTLLNGGVGVRSTDLDEFELTGATLLSVLNQGAGVRFVAGNDFRITLTDGTTINVDLTASILTVQQLITAILAAANAVAPGRLSVVIDPDTLNSLLLNDAIDADTFDLEVTALNGSFAADDLGLVDAGAGAVLSGQSISDLSADLRITLGDGRRLDFNLTGVKTLDDLLELFNDEDPAGFVAHVNSAGTGIEIQSCWSTAAVDRGVNGWDGRGVGAGVGDG